ncbi:hypothetical protein HDE_07663 [Halotydeus destructor]|nr:hypothetical protein HDE_07663 [Halotydeus destructor]
MDSPSTTYLFECLDPREYEVPVLPVNVSIDPPKCAEALGQEGQVIYSGFRAVIATARPDYEVLADLILRQKDSFPCYSPFETTSSRGLVQTYEVFLFTPPQRFLGKFVIPGVEVHEDWEPLVFGKRFPPLAVPARKAKPLFVQLLRRSRRSSPFTRG